MWEVIKHEVNLCSFIHPLWRRKESQGEEEGNENSTLAF